MLADEQARDQRSSHVKMKIAKKKQSWRETLAVSEGALTEVETRNYKSPQ
jgi:hypothetical protein